MNVSFCPELQQLAPEVWNSVAGHANPFIRYEFLAALEQHDCLIPYGWQPMHVLVHQEHRLVGAMPLYVKTNSHGEFVFDWSWAGAYQRMIGKEYYPKLVTSVPFTPATGARLLIAEDVDYAAVAGLLMEGALQLAQHLDASSWHCLFPAQRDMGFLQQQSALLVRMGCQFHWENQGYRDFADYLTAFNSKKRKQIKRERRDAEQSGLIIEVLDGHQATAEHWALFHAFYQGTFLRKANVPALSLEFFQALGATMPTAVVLVMAKTPEGEYVAAAFNLRGTDTLFGRHWGCNQHFRHLHFEVCYYQALEYCINQGMQRFEAGAQGEHKISRGFLPTATWSSHWLANQHFAKAVQNFLQQETSAVEQYIDELQAHSPFKQA